MDKLIQIIREFRNARNWRKFHSPKNLSMAIAIEAGELMERFQWLTTEQSEDLPDLDSQEYQDITDELADVLIYCFNLADIIGCDVEQIILDKIARNGTKYPPANQMRLSL